MFPSRPEDRKKYRPARSFDLRIAGNTNAPPQPLYKEENGLDFFSPLVY
jgi:hypothetical protein